MKSSKKNLFTALALTAIFVFGGMALPVSGAPIIGEFENYKYNKPKDRYDVSKNSYGQTIIAYKEKTSWNSVVADVNGYDASFTRLCITLALNGTQEFGVELTIPGKPNQVVRYADLALSKQSKLNSDGSYTFDIPLSNYPNVRSNGISTIMLYFDPSAKVSTTRFATIIDVGFRKDGEPDKPIKEDPKEEQPDQNRLANINSYICYYGGSKKSGVMERLCGVDLAIIDSDSLGGAQKISELKNSGTIVTAYLTIGEDDGPYNPDNGWYLSSRQTNWTSYMVDAGNAKWQEKILAEAKKLLEQGADGFFLDTVDTVSAYPSTKNGMISLITRIHNTYPDAAIIINRGFDIAADIAPVIDGVMFESFSSDYDGTNYRAYNQNDLKWTENKANELKAIAANHNLKIITLDYLKDYNSQQANEFRNRSLSFGFLPYVAPGRLDSIY